MSNFVYFDVLIRGTLMMENLTHDETRIGPVLPVPRGRSMDKDSERMFQIEATGQKQ